MCYQMHNFDSLLLDYCSWMCSSSGVLHRVVRFQKHSRTLLASSLSNFYIHSKLETFNCNSLQSTKAVIIVVVLCIGLIAIMLKLERSSIKSYYAHEYHSPYMYVINFTFILLTNRSIMPALCYQNT